MPQHDIQCNKCGHTILGYWASPWPSSIRHDEDGGEYEIVWWSLSPSPTAPRPHDAAVHPHDRTVVYKDPITGQIAYPGRNDQPDNKYARRGWERVEFEHARDLEKFEKLHNVINEGLWYNSGNGAD